VAERLAASQEGVNSMESHSGEYGAVWRVQSSGM
jgi:hypothetical protein